MSLVHQIDRSAQHPCEFKNKQIVNRQETDQATVACLNPVVVPLGVRLLCSSFQQRQCILNRLIRLRQHCRTGLH